MRRIRAHPLAEPRLLRGRSAVIGLPYAWLLALLPAALPGGDEDQRVGDGRRALQGPRSASRTACCSSPAASTTTLFITKTTLYFKTYLSSLKYAGRPRLLLPAHRLPLRLLHGTRKAQCAAGAADAGDAAVLDLVAAARLCLEGPARRPRLVADCIIALGLDQPAAPRR